MGEARKSRGATVEAVVNDGRDLRGSRVDDKTTGTGSSGQWIRNRPDEVCLSTDEVE